MCHKLYHPRQYQYLQHPILRTWLKRVQLQTSYQVGWIDYTLQDILGQKFGQYNIQNAKTLQ